jgi:uncharacterized DUF497 family protein
MEFDWDAASIERITRHGISSEECEQAFLNSPLVIERQGRIRFVTAHPMHSRQRELYREEE